MNSNIKKIRALEILDSRGNPTVSSEVTLEDGSKGTCSSPSGASTGTYEAFELRDNDPKRYNGKGVLKAIQNVNELVFQELAGVNSSDQKEIDQILIKLDGTENKAKLGANAILSVSIACAKAAAQSQSRKFYNYINGLLAESQELNSSPKLNIPTPIFNILNGGAHATNNLSFQEFIVIPKFIDEFEEQLRAGVEIDYQLKQILVSRGASTGVGDEGGFAPNLPSDEVAIELILEAITKAGYKAENEIVLGLDIAATDFWEDDDKVYAIPHILGDKPLVDKASKIADFYSDLLAKYPITYLEDPFHEEDWNGWNMLYKQIDLSKHLLVGDDLTVTNPERLQTAIESKAINSLIIKPNQIGTLSEVLEVVKICKEKNITTIFSHRSGETNDTFIVDLAVGCGSKLLKNGAPVRGERVAKYNRLLEITQELRETNY